MDEPPHRLDHPEQLCEAIVGLIDELEEGELIREERASELRSQVYRSIDTIEE